MVKEFITSRAGYNRLYMMPKGTITDCSVVPYGDKYAIKSEARGYYHSDGTWKK